MEKMSMGLECASIPGSLAFLILKIGDWTAGERLNKAM